MKHNPSLPTLIRHRSYLPGTALVLLALLSATLITFVPLLVWPQADGLIVLIFTLGALLGFTVLHTRLQHVLEQVLRPERLTYQRVVEQYGQAAQNMRQVDEFYGVVIHTLRHSLNTSHVSMWVYQAEDSVLVLSHYNGELAPNDMSVLPLDVEPAHLRGTQAVSALPESALRQGWLTLGIHLVSAMRWRGELVGILGLARLPAGTFDRDAASLLDWEAGQLAQVVKNTRLTAELEETLNHLQLAYRQTIDLQEAERRNLAAELHDDILGRLTTMALTLRNCRRQLASAPDQAAGWLETLEKETQDVNRRLREITQGLHPSVLTDLGMISALRAYIDLLARQPLPPSAPRLIALTAQGFGNDRIANPKLERDLYHITRQALDNAVAHAHAEQVFIHLRWSDGGVSVTVQDTGQGMKDAPEVLMGQNGRLGLLSMNERVRAWGGRLSFDTAAGRGTSVRATVPIDQPSPAPTHLQSFTQHLTRSPRDLG